MSALARLAEVIADPNTMSVIVQRITDGDDPETLKQIAKAWQVPAGKLAEWITEDRDRAEKYALALKIAAEQAALDTARISDGVPVQAVDPNGKPLFDETGKPVLIHHDVARDKLRVETRKWLAGKLAREKFGEMNEVKVSGSVSLIAVLSSLPRGRGVDVTPETVTSALPAPVADSQTSLEKNPAKVSEIAEAELI